MVRFKNRHLLVEFLNLSTCSPTVSGTVSALPISPTAGFTDPDDEDDELSPIPPLPFLVPGHDPTSARLKLGDEGGGHIFRVIRSVIQEVFGDEGWARVASSFKIIYHSPATTLTIVRVSRQHYRLVWAGITLLTSINGLAVLPRVVAVSGTIKKLQNRAVGYHRLVTGQMVMAAVERAGISVSATGEHQELERKWAKEVAEIESLED
ncbi:MAG: hypothetical protein TREMPRED_001719 [Tremellales sp. Tagirdzhanova-0007]|nr:MAG: hypothetical protein TREMPRED_001719 [Tremellales sp. Tagirdzhanova-0007]